VVKLLNQSLSAALKTMNEMQLPQGPGAVERPTSNARGEICKLMIITGSGQRVLHQMFPEVEVRVFDPIRFVHSKRHLDEPAPQRTEEMQPLLHEGAKFRKRQAGTFRIAKIMMSQMCWNCPLDSLMNQASMGVSCCILATTFPSREAFND
jgi:hypothetical protein